MPYSIGFENNQKYILKNRIPTACTLEEWAKWFEENPASRIVGRVKGENIEVVTSFVGLSYGRDLYDRTTSSPAATRHIFVVELKLPSDNLKII